MLLRTVAKRAFFTAKPVSPPKVVAVGFQSVLGYDALRRVKHLQQQGAARDVFAKVVVPESAVVAALTAVDEHVAMGAIKTSPDYVDALNAAIITCTEAENGRPATADEFDAIVGIPDDAHRQALHSSLAVAEPLLDILETIKRGKEDCKFALLADCGPLLKVGRKGTRRDPRGAFCGLIVCVRVCVFARLCMCMCVRVSVSMRVPVCMCVFVDVICGWN